MLRCSCRHQSAEVYSRIIILFRLTFSRSNRSTSLHSAKFRTMVEKVQYLLAAPSFRRAVRQRRLWPNRPYIRRFTGDKGVGRVLSGHEPVLLGDDQGTASQCRRMAEITSDTHGAVSNRTACYAPRNLSVSDEMLILYLGSCLMIWAEAIRFGKIRLPRGTCREVSRGNHHPPQIDLVVVLLPRLFFSLFTSTAWGGIFCCHACILLVCMSQRRNKSSVGLYLVVEQRN